MPGIVFLKEKVYLRNNIPLKMDKDCVTQVIALVKIINKFRAKKVLLTLSATPSIFWRSTMQYNATRRLWSNTLKSNELKVSISLKSNELEYFEN